MYMYKCCTDHIDDRSYLRLETGCAGTLVKPITRIKYPLQPVLIWLNNHFNQLLKTKPQPTGNLFAPTVSPRVLCDQ